MPPSKQVKQDGKLETPSRTRPSPEMGDWLFTPIIDVGYVRLALAQLIVIVLLLGVIVFFVFILHAIGIASVEFTVGGVTFSLIIFYAVAGRAVPPIR